MVKVTLEPNESVEIHLKDTDGCFRITYGKTKLTVKETAGCKDSKGRGGVIYEEKFASAPANAAPVEGVGEQPPATEPAAVAPATTPVGTGG